MTPDLATATWRKASYSGNEGGNCIELAQPGAVRDSKNPNGPALQVGLDSLLSAVKDGKLNR